MRRQFDMGNEQRAEPQSGCFPVDISQLPRRPLNKWLRRKSSSSTHAAPTPRRTATPSAAFCSTPSRSVPRKPTQPANGDAELHRSSARRANLAAWRNRIYGCEPIRGDGTPRGLARKEVPHPRRSPDNAPEASSRVLWERGLQRL